MTWSTPKIEFSKEVYLPGENVTGKVLVSTKKDLHARKVEISFFGKTATAWRIDGKRRNRPVDNFSHRQAEDTFLEMTHVVWSPENERNIFSAGDYEWNFSFELPQKCLPSFEATFGFIRYFVRVQIDVPNWIDTIVESAITVSPIVDLNSMPTLNEPFELQMEKSNQRCMLLPFLGNNGLIVYTLQSPRSGYVAGEEIVISGTIENQSSKTLEMIQATFKRRITYRKDLSKSIFKFRRDNSVPADSYNSRREDRILAEINETTEIGPGETKPFRFTFTVPQVVSTIRNCTFISVEYFITVSVDHGYFGTPVVPIFNVFVGNVPFKGNEFRPRKFVKMESAQCWSARLTPKFRYQIPYYGSRPQQTEDDLDYPFFRTTQV